MRTTSGTGSVRSAAAALLPRRPDLADMTAQPLRDLERSARFLQEATALTAQQWQSFWWLPAGFAVGVMVLFALLFREKRAAK